MKDRPDKSFRTEDLKRAFQPTALEKVTEKSDQIGDALKACIGLGLAQRDTPQTVKSANTSSNKTSKAVLLEAFDRVVLDNSETEEWFSKFYSYIIARIRITSTVTITSPTASIGNSTSNLYE